jgi:hypothetical protein
MVLERARLCVTPTQMQQLEQMQSAQRKLDESHDPVVSGLLRSLTMDLASGKLDPHHIFVTYIAYGQQACINAVDGKSNRNRWPQELKDLWALAQSQRSGQGAINVLHGDTAFPNLPGPSRTTLYEHIKHSCGDQDQAEGVFHACRACGISCDICILPCLF